MAGPVRVGDTVRRSPGPNTAFVHRLLAHLEAEGVTWAPRALGFDEAGREVLSWIPGDGPSSGDGVDLHALARIVRALHDLTVGLVEGGECVIHDDLQPRNVIVQDQVPVGLIDWEQARPGRRVEDVAKLCWSFSEPRLGRDAIEVGTRWREASEAYGLDRPDEVLATVLEQIPSCADDIEREAASGSARHQALADRGDHDALRSMHAWVLAHEGLLRATLEG